MSKDRKPSSGQPIGSADKNLREKRRRFLSSKEQIYTEFGSRTRIFFFLNIQQMKIRNRLKAIASRV